MTFKKDTIYQHTTDVVDFDFDKKVAQVFPDMVHRSIPGYSSLLTVMQAVFRSAFANRSDISIYDLGCSVGGVTLALANVLPADTHFTGVDISADMLARYENAIRIANLEQRVTIMQQNIVDLSLMPCDAISINFTLQFLAPEDRQSVLDSCFKNLNKEGILFIAEKTRTTNNVTQWHEQFKRNNGYSDLEIAQKRRAIENVMKIDNESTITQRCKSAGFTNITQVFHALGFKGWVVEK
ncbi:MAG: methyltransferase domain-containing protein [Gammaproteobacteria bacterium]|nr:methyltransferase domain-containing protein [Gammaproteobacteria bacterium]